MMLHIDPSLPFDDRVRKLTANAELLLYRGLCLAGLMCKEPLALTTRQFEILIYEMDTVDQSGNLEPAISSDAERWISELVKAGLVSRVYGGDSGLLIFSEDIAEFCKPTEAKPKQTESKPQKLIDPELSKKRREAGRKGGLKRKQADETPMLAISDDSKEGAA